MAEEALRKLEEQLQCVVCLGTYIDPKQLQCHHTYCKECLMGLTKTDEQGKVSVTCPNCRQVTPVTDSGVGGLQPAFQINNLLEIQESFKKAETVGLTRKDSEAETIPEGEELEPSQKGVRDTNAYCSEHVDEELKIYCNTCELVICLKCVIKDSQHQNHNYVLLEKAYEQYEAEILHSLAPVEEQLVAVEKALHQVDTECGEISQQTALAEDSIHDTIDKFQKMLDARKTELIGQLHEIAQKKLKGLATQRDLLEIDQVQLMQCVSNVREKLKTGDKREVMKVKTTTERQVAELTVGFKTNTFKLCTRADITFSTLINDPAVFQNLGSVCETKKLSDPSQCFIKSGTATVGETATAVMQANDYYCNPCEELSGAVGCKVVSDITHVVVEATVERKEKGKYLIRYEPSVQGNHCLHFKIEGQHIHGSPYLVHAKLPRTMLGVTPVASINDLKGPWGVAVNKKGEIFVSEHEGHCISVFRPSGEKIRSFGSYGSKEGQFNKPRGITLDREGNVLVTDCNNHRIQKFAVDGTFLSTVGSSSWIAGPFLPASSLKFRHPKAIAFNSSNEKFFVLDELVRVRVLNADLTYSDTVKLVQSVLGAIVPLEMMLPVDPWGVACDSNGNLYIATSNLHFIQVFTAEGKFLRIFGNKGKRSERLNFPVGIAVDTSDTVYVTERYNHRVSMFTTKGEYIRSFGEYGKEPGQFSYPRGLAVDNSGVVYVCDNNNNRITMF